MMAKKFMDHLRQASIVSDRQMGLVNQHPSRDTEQVGSIAMTYGMLTGGDIDIILDEQRREYRMFGKIAVELGMLSPKQVDNLYNVQQMRKTVEVAEALILSGTCPFADVCEHLGSFLAGRVPTEFAGHS